MFFFYSSLILFLSFVSVPENFNYVGAREMFTKPDVTNVDDIDLKWTGPDEEGLIQFLVNEKEFNLDRVTSFLFFWNLDSVQ